MSVDLQSSKTHREAFPEQYTHPMCGREVLIDTGKTQVSGVLERVVSSRFGQLGILVGDGQNAYRLADITLAGARPVDLQAVVHAIVEWFGDESKRSLATSMAEVMIADGRIVGSDAGSAFQLKDGVDLNEVACEVIGQGKKRVTKKFAPR